MFPWSFHALLLTFTTLLTEPCCFNSQVNISLDDFQLSKTVFILARFCPNKLVTSADKGCMILVPRSDLFRPRDFYGFDRFEISHFLPFLRYWDARRRFQFLYAKSCKDGTFFLEFVPFFADQNTNIIPLGYDECLNSLVYSIKAFFFFFFR